MPYRTTLLTLACTILAGPLAASVAAKEPATAPATAPATQPGAKFRLIREAPLPDGFPEPAPVGKVVLKDYPAYRLARTTMADLDQDGAFMTLFRHIEANDIKMTAPVEMTYEAAKAGEKGVAKDDAGKKPRPRSMAFLYQGTDIGKPGKPDDDGKVEVVDVPAMTVLSIAVRGAYSEAQMETGLQKLQAWLAEHPEYEIAGPPRMLGYNSPFVPAFLRYGEVQLPVKQKPQK